MSSSQVNRAVARAFADGPERGLALLTPDVAASLDGYQPFHAARAGLLERAGRGDEALVAYERALALTEVAPERRYLEERCREIREAGAPRGLS